MQIKQRLLIITFFFCCDSLTKTVRRPNEFCIFQIYIYIYIWSHVSCSCVDANYVLVHRMRKRIAKNEVKSHIIEMEMLTKDNVRFV